MTLIFQLIDIIKTLRMIKLGKYHRSIKLIIESLGLFYLRKNFLNLLFSSI
jgi:hypothetical protein